MVEVLHPPVEVRITIANSLQVAFEVEVVDGIKSNLVMSEELALALLRVADLNSTYKGGINSNISLGKDVSNQVILALEDLFKSIERLKQGLQDLESVK